MAMTAAHQQICAIVACGRLFANSVAHFNTADALAAVQAVDAALDATLTQAVAAAGGKRVSRKGVSRIAHPPCRIREGGGFIVVTFEGHRVLFGKKLWGKIGAALVEASKQEHVDPVTIEG